MRPRRLDRAADVCHRRLKLPSNASKAKSGTRADFMREMSKMRAQVQRIIARHRSEDQSDPPRPEGPHEQSAQLQRLSQRAQQIERWLNEHPEDRRGARNSVRQSNRTDNESAKMATEKGVIQGYTAVAAVDDKHQIVVEAQPHGVGHEQELLMPLLDALEAQRNPDTLINTDAGYYSKANIQALDQRAMAGCIPDPNYRSRDARYAGQERHKSKPKALWDKRKIPARVKLFRPQDFRVQPI